MFSGKLVLFKTFRTKKGKWVIFLWCYFSGAIMSAIYEEKKDDDGFLYVTYSGENTFGDD